MMTEEKLRIHIRNVLNETVNNFLDKEEATKTKQIGDNTKSQVLGDPLTDVELNQNADELGSDGKNAPTVSVKPGSTKGGNGPTAGQSTAVFNDKTKLA